jgi:hypothetical protein
MDWIQITSALFLAAMLIFVFPRMMQAIKHSPKGNMQDWMGFIIPITAVVGFVILLILMVR